MLGIIYYDGGNVKSVQNVLSNIGERFLVSDNKHELDVCEKIIFPGVGSAESAMQSLHEKGLTDWIVHCQKPFLGICLGMQLLFDFSEEGGTQCLGIVPGKVRKFQPTKKIPHMGWNQIQAYDNSVTFDQAYVYFVHSYLAPVNTYTIATCEYEDETFTAMIRRGNFWGMQFHPEKSGDTGRAMLADFIGMPTENSLT